ncbi:hypothetical protein C0J52_19814 [Blattella germanica]|nr:hypothetical protein C0J52_19814 [Blattella germanica]
MDAKVKDLEMSCRRIAREVAPPNGTRQNHLHDFITEDIGTTSSGHQSQLFSDVVCSVGQKVEKRYKVMVSSKIRESTEAMKTTLKTKIHLTMINVGIKTLKSLKDGRVLIETGSKEEIEILSETINTQCCQTLEAEVVKLRNPNLIIYNIPEEFNKENIEETIRAQNAELALEEGDNKSKLIYRNKRNNWNIVVEVRKKLLQHKIKLGWVICNSEEYLVLVRCFNCSRYNHR